MNIIKNKKNSTTTTTTINDKNIYKKEFQYNVKNDGIIIIRGDVIIKKKPKEKLTVDLAYDSVSGGFLDMDKNVYMYKKTTINELYNL